MRPVAIDLFCGLGGWTKGFLAEGYEVIGFDIEHKPSYPGEFILMDVAKLCGYDLRAVNPTVIVASPPCQAYSYRAMPWKRAKALPPPDNTLFDACFRIAREAGCPLVVENVKGAQPWVGRAKWHYGSFYLWGDVPALMPSTRAVQKFNPDGTNHGQGSWFAIADSKNRGARKSAAQSPGKIWGDRPPDSQWSGTHGLGLKNEGGGWFNIAHNTESGTGQNPVHALLASRDAESGMKGLGGGWFDKPYKERGDITGRFNSKSSARKAASAAIAEIPFDLAQWIARCFLP